MFGCVAGRRGRLGGFVSAIAVVFSAHCAFAQTGGFPLDEPPRAASPTPAPVAPAPVAPTPVAPAPIAPPATPSAPPATPYAVPAPAPSYPGVLPPVADSSLPALLPYRDGLPVPRGYHVENRPASGLIITGALTLGVGYVVGLGLGLDKGFEGSLGWLVLPVVGAWPAIAGREIQCVAGTVEEARQCLDLASREATTVALVAVDGMIQTTGLLILLAGLASGRPELVRDDVGVQVTAGRRREGGFELGLTGRF